MPVYPPPLDCWASAEMVDVHPEVRIRRRQLAARVVLHRCRARRAVAGCSGGGSTVAAGRRVNDRLVAVKPPA